MIPGTDEWNYQQTYPLVNVYITMENNHFQWVNPLFQWAFSIAMLVYQRVVETPMFVASYPHEFSSQMSSFVLLPGCISHLLIWQFKWIPHDSKFDFRFSRFFKFPNFPGLHVTATNGNGENRCFGLVLVLGLPRGVIIATTGLRKAKSLANNAYRIGRVEDFAHPKISHSQSQTVSNC